MDGERGRPGAPGQPVSVKSNDAVIFLTHFFHCVCTNKHQACSHKLAFTEMLHVNFRDILDLEGSKDPKEPKEIK